MYTYICLDPLSVYKIHTLNPCICMYTFLCLCCVHENATNRVEKKTRPKKMREIENSNRDRERERDREKYDSNTKTHTHRDTHILAIASSSRAKKICVCASLSGMQKSHTGVLGICCWAWCANGCYYEWMCAMLEMENRAAEWPTEPEISRKLGRLVCGILVCVLDVWFSHYLTW